MTPRKKLIEVALPLEAINVASAREKSIRHGHPSTLHLWWARRPLAAARAVIFTSLVDDPDDPNAPPEFVEACRKLPARANASVEDTPRQRLFDFIETLVKWESTTDETVLNKARELIKLSTGGNPPPLLDPFAGGGSIPLEAQRLGLEAHASDLNPVAVMINKALIEIPPRFANLPPVNPRDRSGTAQGMSWKGAQGLAADVRYYGEWMRDRAWERIGHLYPKGPNGETVIAWLWARTVKCPNPACGAQMPLLSSLWLSKNHGKEAWLEPVINRSAKSVSFAVKNGRGVPVDGTISRTGALCLVCGEHSPLEYIRSEGRAGRISAMMTAVVAEGVRRRIFLASEPLHLPLPASDFLEDIAAPEISGYFNPPLYGYATIGSMFSARQRIALETFSSLVQEAKQQCLDDGSSEEYASAVAVYLTLGVGRLSNRLSAFAIWNTQGLNIEQTFSEQGVGMTWDFAEVNPFSDSTGNWKGSLEWIPQCLERLPSEGVLGVALQQDAAALHIDDALSPMVSTDPPYYSNITFADFADFFYGTFRHSLKSEYPELFGTLSSPKADEAVAAWHRFEGDRTKAATHFRRKLLEAMTKLRATSNIEYPVSVYYAFKEKELAKDPDSYLTAWESILSVMIDSGLRVCSTWPMRTERPTGRKERKNALASSIVLVCRPRPDDAPTISRREFVNALRRELPEALREMQSGSIAPVDLAQASIGPGMAVYSRYRQVLEADGSPLTVRTALQLINQELDAFLAETEGDVDADTRFAVSWFEQFGFKAGEFGVADVLARAKNTSVDGLVNAGVVEAGAGKVRLKSWDELDPGWTPQDDRRITVWEAVHHLIERLNTHGEQGAASLLAQMDSDLAAEAKNLAYRLYQICDRKGWAEYALEYNAVVLSWPGVQQQATVLKENPPSEQLGMF